MKAFLVNLLIVVALGLCAFNAYQWQREARLRAELEQRGSDLFQKSSEIQNLKQSLGVSSDEIKRIEGLRETLASNLKSNLTRVAELDQAAAGLRRDLDGQQKRATVVEQQYKEAFDKANENIRQQNEIIQSQNDKMKELVTERNDVVVRFNKLASDYKTLGEDYAKVRSLYTNLVGQVQAANQKR